MKKLISGLAWAIAFAAKNEIFTLALLLVFAAVLAAELMKGCKSRRSNDVWAMDWEV